MKEFLHYFITLNIKALFTKKTDNTILQFFRYIFVGGFAFVVDFTTLLIFEKLFECIGVSDKSAYLFATPIAFILGLIANFILSKFFVFSEKKENKFFEFLVYTIIGIIGLALTELLMYLFKGGLHLPTYGAKIIVSIIVLIWNFAGRKIILYRK